MKKVLSIAAGILVLATACNTSRKTTTATTMNTDGSTGSSTQAQGGNWTTLFDGNTLNGWRTYQNKPTQAWEVQNGVLHCKGSASNSDLHADLITNEQYENFELALDWKIAPQGNSGIMYLVQETAPAAYETGPEYQLIDDANFPEKLENWQKTGSNYAMNPAPTAKPRPVGEWNHARIIVNNGHVEHWLNGDKIVEYNMNSEEWKQAKATGKWKDTPTYGTAKRGHIALQDHGSEAWFKDIKIRKL
jgi:hypothetical protein